LRQIAYSFSEGKNIIILQLTLSAVAAQNSGGILADPSNHAGSGREMGNRAKIRPLKAILPAMGAAMVPKPSVEP
jgi:hypothetical protein